MFKYLGLTLVNQMQWTIKCHIKMVDEKLAAETGFYEAQNILPIKIKKLIFSTLLQSLLNFMLSNWGIAFAKAFHNAQVL